ncbi:MAG: amino acid adenylation domain-containing protein [Clostridiaceae bacterium]
MDDSTGGVYASIHHLISDAWSVSQLGNQIISVYSKLKDEEMTAAISNPSFIDYITNEQEYLDSDRCRKDKEYWHNKFELFHGITKIKNYNPESICIKAKRKTMLLPKKLTTKIYDYCTENKTSVFSIFTAALSMYINRITSKENITFGTTTLNRLNSKEKATTGMFNNIAPMIVNLKDNMNFEELTELVTREGLSLLKHQRYPYDLILKKVRETHKVLDNIFDILLTYHNIKFVKDESLVDYKTRWHFNGYQVDSLHIYINDRENEGHLIIDYDYLIDLFHAKEIDFIHQNLINILWHALDNPTKTISKLEMLSEREKFKILYEFNKIKIIYPEGIDHYFDEPGKDIPREAKCYILDKNQNILPIGIAGQLYISGANLKTEKMNALGISKDMAISNPYSTDDVIYALNCSARWYPDGDILYLGSNNVEKPKEETDEDNKKEKIAVNILSTFTAEPVESYIKWWGKKFGYNINVDFAGYNQVFQELLNPSGMLSENKDGINVLMVRFEDFTRYNKETDQDKLLLLERTYEDLKEAIRKFVNKAPLIISIFPISTHLRLSDYLRQMIAKINDDFITVLSNQKNVYILDFNELQILYGIQEVFDILKDKEGHMPFTEEYYAAMGTELARKIVAIKKQVFKVIVLDCDNTLWKGICGEDGVLGVHVTESYKQLQQFMLQKYKEGMLLAVCSKNNEKDVFNVFDNNPDMILNKSHIISWKVNWRDKSENIKEIANELNLGIDSFIFIDDDSLECSKMVEHCPEVLTLQLPQKDEYIPLFLKHIWAFDRIRVTKEDTLRSKMYEAEIKRNEYKEKNTSLEGFIENLQLKVSMRTITEEEIGRAAQLTQRVNQFNLSTIRRSEDEIAKLMKNEMYKCFVVEAKDKFGEYGIVGLVILKDTGEKIFLDTLLMSCRIFGRNVEDVLLAGIGRYARELGRQNIEAVFIPTEKNVPVYDFIKRMKWALIGETEKQQSFSFNTENLPETIEYIDFYYDEKYDSNIDDTQSTESDLIKHKENETYRCREEKIDGKYEIDYFYDTNPIKNINCSEYIEPLNYLTATKLLSIKSYNDINIECENSIVENETQERLLSISHSLLQANKVGINDDFFEIGGDSLRAVILISRIKKEFGVELTLKDIFKFNTISKLAEKINGTDKHDYDQILPVCKKTYYELSPAQKRMYILNRIEQDSTGYNECHKIMIEGKLDKQKLESAFQQFINRHEIMRTSFEMLEEGPVQRVYNKIDFNISFLRVNPKEVEKIIGDFVKPFDLSKPPLIRVSLLEIGKDKYILLFDIHHIIIDGTSFGILIKEVLALYEGREPGHQEIQYKDFANWQNTFLKSANIKKQEDYWLQQFSDEIPVLNLPTDHQRPAVQSFNGKKDYFTLDKCEVDKLKLICNNTGTTLFMLLYAAFNVLLYRYTGQEDIVVGTPVSGRSHAEAENIVGMFVNTLPIRTYPKGNKEFITYLSEVKETILMGLENQDYQYDYLIEKLNVQRELNRNPLFDVTFSLQNTEMSDINLDGIIVSHCRIDNKKSKFDLSLLAQETGMRIEFELEYCTNLFNDDTIKRFQGHFLNILKEITSNPEILISNIEIMSEEEKRQILYGFNDTQADYPKDKTVHQLFEEQVERTPEKIAVVFENKQITYRELNAKSNQLARALRDKGVKPETIVAIMVERSLEMIIGILAILKAGGAYLPIDPEYPDERIKYMLEDSGTQILLTQKDLISKAGFNGYVFLVDCIASLNENVNNLVNISEPNNLMYLIYTSGTTGKPKGVMVEHRNIVNFIKGINDRICFSNNDTILGITTISFDIFVLETWLPLTRGMKIVLANKKQQFDITELVSAAIKNEVTVIQFTPSRMKLVIEDPKSDRLLKQVRMILLGGESLQYTLLSSIKQITSAKIYNMYGPTETSVWSSLKELTFESEISIGKPISNTQFYVLDNLLRIQPYNIPGELCIAGEGLARGYFNQNELTSEKFISNPYNPDKKIYRTGDLAVLLSDGSIKILGRNDNQVKFMGYRIELSEIEKNILEFDAFQECAVLKKCNNLSESLCAYIVSDHQINEYELKRFLINRIPYYMIPQTCIQLDKMPLNSNGKIDRKRLSEAKAMQPEKNHLYKSEGEVQKILLSIYNKILNIDNIDIQQSFFDLGGDSLQIIKLTIEIYNHFGIELNFSDIYKSSTIEDLSIDISDKLLKGYKSGIDVGAAYHLLNDKRNRNIFAFPPITGFGLAFSEMAKNIKEFSLYAFNYLEDEDKIDKYYNIIKSLQSSEPYVLLGFSAGANIVLDLARKFSKKTIIILMDGFWGEIRKEDIESKVDFFIEYSMEYANLDHKNKFINQILEKRIRNYMYYIADTDKSKYKISQDIHFLHSKDMTESHIESLESLTKGSIIKYSAYGKHFDLLKIGYVENNANIIVDIIKINLKAMIK